MLKELNTRFVIILTAVLFYGGCKKYSHNYFRGTVIEEGSGTPIPGAIAVLQYWDYPKGSGVPYMYDTVYTDAAGKFLFYRRKKIGWAYRLMVWEKDHSSFYMDVTKEKPEYRISLYPSATLQLHVKKRTNSSSTISVEAANQYFSSGFKTGLTTPSYDTLLPPISILALRTQRISWTVTTYQTPTDPPVNQQTLFYDFSLNKNDTLVYLIEYD